MRKDRGINRWELVTCALAGHVTYAPDEENLANRLSGNTGLGEVWRCLRCGEFTLGDPHGHGHAEDAPMIMRGKALRQAIIIRALAAERMFRAVVIALAAFNWMVPPHHVILHNVLHHLNILPFMLAGMFFGVLTYKPQMAVAVFAALFFGRYFRCLAAAVVTTAGAGGASRPRAMVSVS